MSSSEYTRYLQTQPIMASPPVYEPTTSPNALPLDASQAEGRLPVAFLPSYSAGTSSRWWEEAAVEVFRTSHDIPLVTRTVKFIPLPDPTIPATILSGRQKGWLDAFLNILCRDTGIEVLRYDSLSSTAKTIVDIIRQRPFSPTSRWDGSWLFSDLCSSNIFAVAERFYHEIHSAFCTPTFSDWIAWRCGYRCDIISEFLNALLNFRNLLAQVAQKNKIVLDQLLLLQEGSLCPCALPSQQPLLRWMLSTAISFDTSSDPSRVLRFFLDPIAQQFEERCSSISLVGQKLSILDARFRSKIVHEVDPKWPIPFSVDFILWESIQSNTSQELAELNTASVSRLFMEVSIADVLSDGGYLKDVGKLWSELADDALACLSADKELTSYFMRLAECFISLRNVHSATAIGLALSKSGFQPCKPSRVWYIINPKDNFAGCRKYMAQEPFCLPLLFPYIVGLRRSGNAPDKILEIFHLLAGYFGRRQEAEVGKDAEVGEKAVGEGSIVYRNLPNQTEHFSSSRTSKRLEGYFLLDFNGDASNMMRIEANDNAQHEEINGFKSTNQNITMGNQLSQDASKLLNHCIGIESFHSFQMLPVELRHMIWEETFSQSRFFDSNTLQLLQPQNGTIYSLLTPSALYVCRESRTVAQDRLCRTFLFRTWPANTGRIIYFNPKYDVCSYRFTDLIWQQDFIPGRCWFRYVEIIANTNPKEVTDSFGYGFKSAQFHDKFPNLKSLVVIDQYTNLHGEDLRNGWPEGRWNRESKLNQSDWNREWKSVRDFFEKKNISITTPSAVPYT